MKSEIIKQIKMISAASQHGRVLEIDSEHKARMCATQQTQCNYWGKAYLISANSVNA